MKDRSPYITVECGTVDVEDGSFVVLDARGCRLRLPVGGLACIMLGPGTTVTHAAVKLAAEVRCLLIWIGQNGVRLYSAGVSGGNRCDRLLSQAGAALDPDSRRQVILRMYRHRFDEDLGDDLSVEQLRGKEAARVKRIYATLSEEYGVEWRGRRYDAGDWVSADPINRCISSATSCLYGISEAAILIAGYSPAIGFIHTGRPRSFVFDVADLVKYETVVPLAFRVASENREDFERVTRLECRDMFGREKLLERIIPLINSMFEGLESSDREGVVPSPEFSESEGSFLDGGSDCRERPAQAQGQADPLDGRGRNVGVRRGLQLQAEGLDMGDGCGEHRPGVRDAGLVDQQG